MSEGARKALEASEQKGKGTKENLNEFDWGFWWDIANELGFSKKEFQQTTVRQLCVILESRAERNKKKK